MMNEEDRFEQRAEDIESSALDNRELVRAVLEMARQLQRIATVLERSEVTPLKQTEKT